MPCRIEFTPAASRDLRALNRRNRTIARRIVAAIELLKEAPRPPGARKLHDSEGVYRIRVGDYRVLYSVRDEARIVTVARIDHRGQVY